MLVGHRGHSVVELLQARTPDVGIDRARRHQYDVDAPRAQLDSQAIGDGFQRELDAA